MIKKILAFSLLLFQNYFFCQEKIITVIDEETLLPVENATVFYKELNEGTITNNDGTCIVIERNNTSLSIDHLAYNEIILKYSDLKNLDTISLKSKVEKLSEVVVSNFNLKEKLKYVLNNYYKLYIGYSTIRNCSFKETIRYNSELKRFFLTELKWWSKNSDIDYNKPKEKYLQLKLGKILQSKNQNIYLNDSLSVPVKPAIKLGTLINHLYMNHIIGYMISPNVGELRSSIVSENTNFITAKYDTDWKKTNEGFSSRHEGEIVFDRSTMAVVKITRNELRLDNEIETSNKEGNTVLKTRHIGSYIELIFTKNISANKYAFNMFNLEYYIKLINEGKENTVSFQNTLYALKEEKSKKMKAHGLVDLSKDLYNNSNSKESIFDNSILMTKEEQKFLDTN